MLTELHVENFALIDSLDLAFQPGLTVLTGETGAGKSIVVDTINALLGERTGPDVVRQGSDRAFVQGAFDISSNPHLQQSLQQMGYDTDDSLIISREISAQGKTQARINGRMATISILREVTELLADVHGQHEHQLLLAPRWQMKCLDDYGGSELGQIKAEYELTWGRLQQVVSELNRITTDDRERERLADLYRFQLEEIARAELVEGEEEELKAEALRLANLEKLFLAANSAWACLSGGESENSAGAAEQIGQAIKTLEGVAQYDAQIAENLQQLSDALIAIEEASTGLRDWRESLEVDPQRIDFVQSRLDLVNSLKRKYGETITEIIAYQQKIAHELESLDTTGERRELLSQQKEELTASAKDLSGRLSNLRKKAASNLCGSVVEQLQSLGMKGARFQVAIEEMEPASHGADRIEFLISANPGESPRPLAKVASGGETSRIMLALKTVLTSSDPVETLVFDEIDAGIGGRTANVVGEKLKALAAGRQVLSVTHLPQIARFADNHFFIEKESDGQQEVRTVVNVRLLSSEQRVDELARMLGGDQESEAAVQHARELLGVSSDKGE